MPYVIKTESSNEAALTTPKLNISNTGTVPKTSETFAILLQCSGVIEAEIVFTITINVTVSSENVTSLVFNRKKVCLQYEKSATYISLDTVSPSSTHIFYIAVCCAAVLIILLAIMVTLYYVKDRKTHRAGGNARVPTTATTFLAVLPRNSANASSYDSFRRMPSYSLIDERSKDLQDKITELSVQK